MKKPPAATLTPEAKRRDEILRAARKVFEVHGLEGASMRMIALAARCTTGSIYPYFKGKEEIYAELLSRSLQDYSEHLTADVAAASSPSDRFSAVMLAHFDHYESRPGDMSLALYLFNGLKPQGLTRELDSRLNEQLRDIMVIFRECIQALGGHTIAQLEAEVGLHYSVLFGLLILRHTKRTRVMHIDPRQVLQIHIDQTVARLGPADAANADVKTVKAAPRKRSPALKVASR